MTSQAFNCWINKKMIGRVPSPVVGMPYKWRQKKNVEQELCYYLLRKLVPELTRFCFSEFETQEGSLIFSQQAPSKAMLERVIAEINGQLAGSYKVHAVYHFLNGELPQQEEGMLVHGIDYTLLKLVNPLLDREV